jgi:cyclophilin family peptidyl-prolyl cis-trans isomerase
MPSRTLKPSIMVPNQTVPSRLRRESAAAACGDWQPRGPSVSLDDALVEKGRLLFFSMKPRARQPLFLAANAVWLLAGIGVVASLLAARPVSAEAPQVESAPDAAGAKARFTAAQQELRRLIGELQVLQAEYQKPGADKSAVEARFKAAQQQARAASEQLEASAVSVVLADPKNADALEVTAVVCQSALEGDDPLEAVRLADLVRQAGVSTEEKRTQGLVQQIMLAGATAATVLSQPDEATSFIAAAEAAGVEPEKVTELRASLTASRPKVEAEMQLRQAEAQADDLPRVRIETTKGSIVVELFENEAPTTVANFISLVEQGFYAGTPFHRVIGGFMAQGGDPTGSGSGGPGYAIECECDLPGARKHFLGTLSMAHAGPDTGGSQFFLTFRPTEHLDGRHTVFGRVIEGLEVLPKLQRTEGGAGGGPPDKILKAEVIRKRDHAYEAKKIPSRR